MIPCHFTPPSLYTFYCSISTLNPGSPCGVPTNGIGHNRTPFLSRHSFQNNSIFALVWSPPRYNANTASFPPAPGTPQTITFFNIVVAVHNSDCSCGSISTPANVPICFNNSRAFKNSCCNAASRSSSLAPLPPFSRMSFSVAKIALFTPFNASHNSWLSSFRRQALTFRTCLSESYLIVVVNAYSRKKEEKGRLA